MNFFENEKNKEIPEILPVVPTVDVVLFPQMIIPLLLVDEKIIHGVNEAFNSKNKFIIVVACKKNSTNHTIEEKDLFSIGTIAHIIRVIPLENGSTKILIQGIMRAKIDKIIISETLKARALANPIEDGGTKAELQEKIDIIKELSDQLYKTNNISSDFSIILSKINSSDKIADFLISHLTLSTDEFQSLLESKSYLDFFEKATNFLARESEISKLQQKIKTKAREYINNTQKEFYVREQIKALKEEIGESSTEDIESLREKLYSIEESLGEESSREILRCINRLESMSTDSIESNVLRNYLECVFDLPWNKSTDDNIDIKNAKSILDKDHHGLKNVKERILDFLSVKKLSNRANTPILCFYGPPGTGKTSLAQSIAKALNRKFFRVSVGGMKDENEIRGHRRTYVGAIPGRIIKGIRQTQSKNPVIIIDEIDKIGAEFKGDPSAALLEVLDPNQNSSFYDYYLGIPFDLSKAFFIATANNIENIAAPLKDRMEMIEIPSYTIEEKYNIGKNHLFPNALYSYGLEEIGCSIFDEAIKFIIESYTYEAGVRELDRCLKKLCSKIARIYVEKEQIEAIDTEAVRKHLGSPKYLKQGKEKIQNTGVTCGLCWTPYGGDILYIETVLSKGSGKLILTGKLGEVMKESAQTALSFLKTNFKKLLIDEKVFNKYDIHIHVPAGAIPKDGPSAGITIATSIFSAIKKIKIPNTIAMTGEIDLQGNILAVGGIKEKVLAAKQNKIKKIFLPLDNKNDFEEIIELCENIKIEFVEKIETVIEELFNIKITNETIKETSESLLDDICSNPIEENEAYTMQ
jgi:ATP-dependent Lon protease